MDFPQTMLKTALETIPLLGEENYGIWRDKMDAILDFRGCAAAINDETSVLDATVNNELKLLIISKLDSSSHENIVTAENQNSAKLLWKAIIQKFASLQASNRARVFNSFLYLTFNPDDIVEFITRVKVSLKKMAEVGIKLPDDIVAYLILFKFPASMDDFKRQIMHSDKELSVDYVLNHLTQLNNKSLAQSSVASSKSKGDIALFGSKSKGSEPKRCVNGYHHPGQDKNHSSADCWHLHPDSAPEWWRDNQAKWKAKKNGQKAKSESHSAHYLALLNHWIERGDPARRFLLDSGASVHMINDA